MSLEPGTSLGDYEILALLGAGGMGEVYRARDTKLGREVAIKVLPEGFAEEVENMVRFEREAKALASLNHPNIATLHGFFSATPSMETAGPGPAAAAIPFLVMELVPGETLADRITRGPIPIDEARSLFRQIAEGLEAAHERGIIHRDLKPANIKITDEGAASAGRIKILDFGLAKAMAPEGSGSDGDPALSTTLTHDVTRRGQIMGTAAYMAPEQARGEEVDKRADVWAFGCCLFEALSGARAFGGRTATESLAKILEREPAWHDLPEETPATLRRLLLRCLEKSRRNRLRDIGDAGLELEDSSIPEDVPLATATPWSSRRPSWLLMSSVFLTGAVLTATAAWLRWPSGDSEPAAAVRLSVDLRDELHLDDPSIAISRDGTRLVYTADGRLWLRVLNDFETQPLEGGEGGSGPFFSPDGESVGFFADNSLKKVSTAGGVAQRLCPALIPGGAVWTDDNRIIFSALDRDGLLVVDAEGGQPELLFPDRSDAEAPRGQPFRPTNPALLPGGQALFYGTGGILQVRRGGAGQVHVHSLAGDSNIVAEGRGARYLPTGHLLFLRHSVLMAQPFDTEQLAVDGSAVQVIDHVASYSISNNGTLAYVEAVGEVSTAIVRAQRDGHQEALDLGSNVGDPRLSPEGDRLAFSVREAELLRNIYILDLDDPGATPRQLTFNDGGFAVWSPEGDRMAFQSQRDGSISLYSKPADGTGEVRRLTPSTLTHMPSSWSRQAGLAFHRVDPVTAHDILLLRAEPQAEPQPLIATPAYEASASFSPDSRWFAYISDESGQMEVYVRPIAGPAGVRYRISTNGGRDPVWSRDGREIFYRHGRQLLTVPVAVAHDRFEYRSPEILFEGDYSDILAPFPQYDVSADGQTFYLVKVNRASASEVRVVVNFFDELERLVPTDGS